jgi:hypothetical protein
MAVDALWQAREDHERAKRDVKRLAAERVHQRSHQLDRLYYRACDRVEQTLARLAALTAEATPPDGAGSRQETRTQTTQPERT